jgi:hypothetical protein
MTADELQPLLELIKNLELKLLQPATRHSVERLNELLADDFLEIGASGKRYGKQEVLNTLPTSPAERFNIHDFEVKELSAQIILATYRVEKEISGSGERVYSLRSSIWQKQNGQWKIIFHQGTAQ